MESGASPTPKRPRRRLATTNELWWKRNSKCTPELQAEIEQLLKRGLPIIHICGLVGISQDSYYGWLRQGRDYLNDPNPLPALQWKGDFYLMHHRALAEWQMDIIDRSLGTPEYKAIWVRDMAILERRDPDNWGREDRNSSRSADIDPDLKFL